jgi:serine/threonine protein kinase
MRKLGKYTLHKELGRGQFGVVYSATVEGEAKEYAIKSLKKSVSSS